MDGKKETYKSAGISIKERVMADTAITRQTFTEPYQELSTTHVHDQDELCVINSGEMKFINGFDCYTHLKAGEATIIRKIAYTALLLPQRLVITQYIPSEIIRNMELIWISNTVKAFRNNNRFYFVRNALHGTEIVDGTCHHRGGALIFDTSSNVSVDTIICPWHQRKNYKKEVCERVISAVHIGCKILIILHKTNFKTFTYGIKDL